eukprot:TRINITY_DN1048_c0_g1_i1.p1 TRINITY_DN1048_c0_g1~~TRINITY_DN1048_c0_g1_i1.p1  ORF type:complete len:452 (+),score=103.73 TRINITY_DN1048_c0_g1_i1:166-1521(+)
MLLISNVLLVTNIVQVDKEEAYGSYNKSYNIIDLIGYLSTLEDNPISSHSNAQMDYDTSGDYSQINRKFNIDISPLHLWGKGPVVDLIIRSGVHRYVEFKCLQKSYMFVDQKFVSVPCSQADVFSNKFLSLTEKRMIMKFFKSIQNEEEYDPDLSFQELLIQMGLNEKLQSFILYSIVMLDKSSPPISVHEGMGKLNLYVSSLGTYGSTPFLYPLFGASDLSQAFCRLSAVYGATFILRNGVEILEDEEETFAGVKITDGDEIKAKYFISNYDNFPLSEYIEENLPSVQYSICITNKSLEPKSDIMFAAVPPGTVENINSIFITQLDGGMRVVPDGYYVVYLHTTYTESAQSNLENLVHTLFCGDDDEFDDKPKLLFSSYYTKKNRSHAPLPGNMTIIPDIEQHISFSEAYDVATKIFLSLYPDQEIMPEVPNPEDIIFEPEEEEQVENSM